MFFAFIRMKREAKKLRIDFHKENMFDKERKIVRVKETRQMQS